MGVIVVHHIDHYFGLLVDANENACLMTYFSKINQHCGWRSLKVTRQLCTLMLTTNFTTFERDIAELQIKRHL